MSRVGKTSKARFVVVQSYLNDREVVGHRPAAFSFLRIEPHPHASHHHSDHGDGVVEFPCRTVALVFATAQGGGGS